MTPNVVAPAPEALGNDILHLDSVAAVICHDDRFLLQHREDKPHVSYPGWWSLFGADVTPIVSSSWS